VTSLAEETYNQLSDDVTCRASALRSLVLTSCSSDVVQLLTALCSQLLHLQLTDCTQVRSCFSTCLLTYSIRTRGRLKAEISLLAKTECDTASGLMAGTAEAD